MLWCGMWCSSGAGGDEGLVLWCGGEVWYWWAGVVCGLSGIGGDYGLVWCCSGSGVGSRCGLLDGVMVWYSELGLVDMRAGLVVF